MKRLLMTIAALLPLTVTAQNIQMNETLSVLTENAKIVRVSADQNYLSVVNKISPSAQLTAMTIYNGNTDQAVATQVAIDKVIVANTSGETPYYTLTRADGKLGHGVLCIHEHGNKIVDRASKTPKLDDALLMTNTADGISIIQITGSFDAASLKKVLAATTLTDNGYEDLHSALFK